MNLPKVAPRTYTTVEEQLSRAATQQNSLADQLQTIRDSNPVIYKTVVEIVKNAEDLLDELGTGQITGENLGTLLTKMVTAILAIPLAYQAQQEVDELNGTNNDNYSPARDDFQLALNCYLMLKKAQEAGIDTSFEKGPPDMDSLLEELGSDIISAVPTEKLPAIRNILGWPPLS